MPLFALHAIDRPDALPLRLEHYAAHRAFIETASEHGIVIVLSGPMQSDDGEVMIGSLFVVEASGREAVEAFANADPFHQAGVWGDVKITRFYRRRG